MQAESLEVLEKASVAPAHARAIVRAIEIELVRDETLATKNDLAVLGVNLRAEMAALRGEIAKQGGELRAEVYGATRQMYMALLTQAIVLLASFCFLVLLLRLGAIDTA
jgi:hypothetical protein